MGEKKKKKTLQYLEKKMGKQIIFALLFSPARELFP